MAKCCRIQNNKHSLAKFSNFIRVYLYHARESVLPLLRRIWYSSCLDQNFSLMGIAINYNCSLIPRSASFFLAGSVVIAAITSCTNTSNPSVMLGAGLLAKKAVECGLKVRPYIKTSLSPGSGVVTYYLKESGVIPVLEKLG